MHTFRTVSLVVFIILVTLGLVFFAINNSEVATVKFLHWEASYPLCVQLFFAAVFGALITSFIALIEIVRLQSRLRRSRRLREMLEREVDALRNQPLFDESPQSEKGNVSKSSSSSEGPDLFEDLPKPLRRENIG